MSLGHFLELFFSLTEFGNVRVIFVRQLAIGLFDHFMGGIRCNTKARGSAYIL